MIHYGTHVQLDGAGSRNLATCSVYSTTQRESCQDVPMNERFVQKNNDALLVVAYTSTTEREKEERERRKK